MIQGRMILDATNNTSYKDAFVGRADLLMSLEQKFKGDIVSRSVYSRDTNEFIEADKVDDQSGLTVLNKNIVDYKFTASIEKDLDLVAEAKLERVKMLKDF